MNRCLQINDSKGNKISEEDLLLIECNSFSENDGFWRSNLGKHCKENHIYSITIQLKNCYPFLKVEYDLFFEPTKLKETYFDQTFLRYVAQLSVNQTNKNSTDVDLNQNLLLDIKNKDGEYVRVGERFTISKEKIQWEQIVKKEWIDKLQPIVDSIEVFTVNDDFYLKTVYKFKHQNGRYFNRKEAFCLTEDEFNSLQTQDKSWYLEEDEQTSLPFKNHGESLLNKFLDMK